MSDRLRKVIGFLMQIRNSEKPHAKVQHRSESFGRKRRMNNKSF